MDTNFVAIAHRQPTHHHHPIAILLLGRIFLVVVSTRSTEYLRNNIDACFLRSAPKRNQEATISALIASTCL